MYCPQCGYDNPDDAKFCIGCRYEYKQKEEPVPSIPQPEDVRAETKTQKNYTPEVVLHDQEPSQPSEEELRAERISRMQGPSKNPLRGCAWNILGILVLMILAIIAASMGYVLLGYAILFGG